VKIHSKLIYVGLAQARPNHEFFVLVECSTLWDEPERVHVQTMEQLHAHDCYQNVDEHKPQATV